MEGELLSSEKNGYLLKVGYDEFGSPREEFDNLSTMFCFHRRYSLGDNQRDKKNPYKESDFGSWEEMKARIIKDFDPAIIEPLYLYDHTMQSISTESFIGRAHHAEWDSGQVGFVFVSKKDVKSEYGENKEALERARKVLEAEVKQYDLHIRGEVYGFTLEKVETCKCCGHDEGDFVGSSGGFYGDNWKENGLLEVLTDYVDKDTATALVEALS